MGSCIVVRAVKKNLTLAIALAAFVFFLAVFVGVGPAHADEPPPNMIIPGGGGDDPPNMIRGCVVYRIQVDPPVPGVSVRLYGGRRIVDIHRQQRCFRI
jgi:hypothetical protein